MPEESLRESNNLRFEELRETNAELSSLQASESGRFSEWAVSVASGAAVGCIVPLHDMGTCRG